MKTCIKSMEIDFGCHSIRLTFENGDDAKSWRIVFLLFMKVDRLKAGTTRKELVIFVEELVKMAEDLPVIPEPYRTVIRVE